MHWECGECGHLVRRQREAPHVCGACGIAGTFVRADPAAQETLAPGWLAPDWLGGAWERPPRDEHRAERDR